MVEEFDYLNSNISEPFNEALVVRSDDMLQREVRDRARLLYNLRYDVKKATARIRNNVAWEFDHSWNKNDPAVLARVDDIVADVYKRMEGKRD